MSILIEIRVSVNSLASMKKVLPPGFSVAKVLFMSRPTSSSQKSFDPEQWVDQYGDYLFRYALGRLRNPELAENAVQETFLAALKARDSFAGKSSERTWLTGILKHKILDHFRQNYREVPVTDLQSDEKTIDGFFDAAEQMKTLPSGWLPDPKKLLETKEFWGIFEMCRDKLPKATADAFTLREIDGMDSRETCKVLEITATNLWVMLHRARLQLKQCLETNWNEKI